MRAIIDSIKPVVEKSRHVRINQKAILKFTKIVTAKDFDKPEYNSETVIENGSEEEQVAYSIVYNSLNFCYWGQPKWTITINEKNYDGSFGMLQALKRGLEKGYQLLNSNYLASLPKEDLRNTFAGNTEIPLFPERLRLLRNLGQIVTKKFNSSFLNIVKGGKFDSIKIVEILTKDFSKIFDDTASYHGQKVVFYKRAQLVPAHLVDLEKFGLISKKLLIMTN